MRFRLLSFGVLVGTAILFRSVFSDPMVPEPRQEDDPPAETTVKFSDADLEFFESKVRPLLSKHCYKCHGPDEEEPDGGLIVGSRKALLAGGDSGPAIVAGHPEKSLLIESINYEGDYEMPPASKLPQESIDILSRWVKMGAPWPADQDVALARKDELDIEQRKSEHWCWQPIGDPAIPEVQDGSWPRESIDHFILNRLEAANLKPAAEVDRRTWIRRVYFDLIGLPPSPKQIEAFEQDPSEHAYEKVVDHLLASPRFGEHWTRRWMDLVRYAETCGHEFDYPIPHAYQYRDYLIRAFNGDVPYDKFVTEHIAGDLMPNPRMHPTKEFNESILGTGFWFLGEATHAPVDVRGDEAGHIDNQIDVMTKTFLGLTVACARCHDHKFDAISMEDFYSLAGYLQSSRRQLALLDENHVIENRFREIAAHKKTLDESARQYANRITVQPDQITPYVNAALEYLSHDQRWLAPRNRVVVQGEDLKASGNASGETKTQTLNPQKGFAWSGNRQFWWIDGEQDDRLTVEFQSPHDGYFDLRGVFTKAFDYGKFEVSVDGNSVLPSLDFYAPELSKTDAISISKLRLTKGNHRLQFKVLECNKKAARRNMLGIDFLELLPIEDPRQAATAEQKLAETLKRYPRLDAALLSRWIEGIKDPELAQPAHPLHIAQQVARQGTSVSPESLASLKQNLQKLRLAQQAKRDDSILFEDFDRQSYDGWFRTGWAFDRQPTRFGEIDVTQKEQPFVRPGVAHSGRHGGGFYGVLRSPTFTLEKKFIHYRTNSRNAQIRLVIDGYTMLAFNPLLFNGASLKVDTKDQYQWRQQGQDVGNYVGHRAYIEIIDHSDGHAAVDEIWFSDEGGFQDLPSNLGILALENCRDGDSAAFGQSLAKSLAQTVAGDSVDSISILNWMFRHQLIPSAENDTAWLAKRTEYLEMAGRRVRAPRLAVAITDGTGEDEFVFVRGNHNNLSDLAPRRMISALESKNRRPLAPTDGSGRLRLARKIVDPANPLTARVVTNRVWHHLFGRGIVGTCDNFGVLGQKPTHPELLDHLATSFVRDGWSLKRLMRRIVLSSTYRMSSQLNPAATDVDPTNALQHRAHVKRLSGEQIRDTMLKVSGQLNETMYGPSVAIHLTPFMQGRGRPAKSGPLEGEGRRSVYVEVRRNFLSPMMLAFDTPIPFNAVGRRNVSNVPAQALILMNDPFVLAQAEHWAKRTLARKLETGQAIETLYREAIGRAPSDEEKRQAMDFLKVQAAELGFGEQPSEAQQLELWRDLCHILFNVKEFIYIH